MVPQLALLAGAQVTLLVGPQIAVAAAPLAAPVFAAAVAPQVVGKLVAPFVVSFPGMWALQALHNGTRRPELFIVNCILLLGYRQHVLVL